MLRNQARGRRAPGLINNASTYFTTCQSEYASLQAENMQNY